MLRNVWQATQRLIAIESELKIFFFIFSDLSPPAGLSPIHRYIFFFKFNIFFPCFLSPLSFLKKFFFYNFLIIILNILLSFLLHIIGLIISYLKFCILFM